MNDPNSRRRGVTVSETQSGTLTIEEMREQVRGQVVTAGDDNYDKARKVYSAMIEVGSNIHDFVRLVRGYDLGDLADKLAAGGAELTRWVGETLARWFSPDTDLRYTLARLRRLSRSGDVQAIAEETTGVLVGAVAEQHHARCGLASSLSRD